MPYRAKAKHKDPWQSGRKGTLCSHGLTAEQHHLLHVQAGRLLDEAVQWEHQGVRYAVFERRPYMARPYRDGSDDWYGYPVGFLEVPAGLWHSWVENGLIRHSDVKRWWTLEDW